MSPGGEIKVDADGTLRIKESALSHAGKYKCIAKNVAGNDTRDTVVVVQEPPEILASTPLTYSEVEGGTVTMRCDARGSPQPDIEWYRRGTLLTNDMADVRVAGATLTLSNVQANDEHGTYTCRAVNAAGQDEVVVKLTVIVPPEIPDTDKIAQEDVLAGQPLSLYCLVYSTPIPEITWMVNERPVAENDPNIELSDDKRRLHIGKARIQDAGVYKCIARNAAGESVKTFEVEVLGENCICVMLLPISYSATQYGRVQMETSR